MKTHGVVLVLVLLLSGIAGAQQQVIPPDQVVPVDPVPAEVLKLLAVQGPAALPSGVMAAGVEPMGSGVPRNLQGNAAFSATVMTSLGAPFNEISMLGDLDGREDLAVDHAAKVEDLSLTTSGLSMITRAAISGHTIANGYPENIIYYGDSVGNLHVVSCTDFAGPYPQPTQFTINLPTVLNAFGTLLSDDQIMITGVAVSPVCDLSSFSNVNGTFSEFAGKIGEMVYVSYLDTGSGLRLGSSGQVVRSGLLAFPVADYPTVAGPTPPGILSPAGFPVTFGGGFGVVFSVFSNVGGIAVDDDGSVYFHQADLTQFMGGNIVKITDVGDMQDRSLAVSGILTITTLSPTNGVYGTSSGPNFQVNRCTNFSGTSRLFGNIAAIAAGPGNVLYAAVARTPHSTDPPEVVRTCGPFAEQPGLGPTPSMIISFADTFGGWDYCSGPLPGVPGVINIGDGIADAAQAGTAVTPGVNNFRVFAHGTGPDRRGAPLPAVMGTVENTLQLDFMVDYTIYSGLVVDEENKVYLVSGGTPAGVGLNPSPDRGEILLFRDRCPSDRRADYVDQRGNGLPNPPASGGNTGDGDSDRFDFLFWVAPNEPVSLLPAGISGLSRGFLKYLNRSEAMPTGTFVPMDDDVSTGPILFEDFDPSHQVAGGDDQNPPYAGDDFDGAGDPLLADTMAGGFEFSFGKPGAPVCVWNGFYLNSNGNITFGTGDSDNYPTVPNLRTGPPRISPAWADLNPTAHLVCTRSFPVMAMGFSEVNRFKIRYINVPEFSKEVCAGRNNFSITLLDDGTVLDENTPAPQLPEGSTGMVFDRDPITGVLVGASPRGEGTGQFFFDYHRMDMLGTPSRPVLVGYSVGGLSALNPPGLCESDLSEDAWASDTDPFRRCLLGEGTESTIFEYFDSGADGSSDGMGNVTFAACDFDLREQGNDPIVKPVSQVDLSRDDVGFFGMTCSLPPAPMLAAVTPVLPVAVAPGQPAVGSGPTPTSGIINAICDVTLNIHGSGFMPNEATTVCEGDAFVRAGKTVVTAATLTVDSNGDLVPDLVMLMTNVYPISDNLIRGTLPPQPAAAGTPFPFEVCGGPAIVTVTTYFSTGDNNMFGSFTRTATFPIELGTRAPLVLGVAPGSGSCATPQDLILAGSCFRLPGGAPNVTQVYAVDSSDPNNVIFASPFTILNNTTIDAVFDFSGNPGRTFLIYALGPNGTSRNLISLPDGAEGCPLGNEQGVNVTYTCTSSGGGCSDLVGTWTSGYQTCTTRYGNQYCRLNGSLSVRNTSAGTISGVVVTFFLSDDGILDPGDTQVGQRSLYPIYSGATRTASFYKSLPVNTSASGRYLLARVALPGVCENVVSYGTIP